MPDYMVELSRLAVENDWRSLEDAIDGYKEIMASKTKDHVEYKNIKGIPCATFQDILESNKSKIYGSWVIIIGLVFNVWFVKHAVMENDAYVPYDKSKHQSHSKVNLLIPIKYKNA